MNHTLSCGAAALLLAITGNVAAFAPEIPGYRPEVAETGASLPTHLIIEQDRIRPQYAYGYVSVGYPTNTYPQFAPATSTANYPVSGLFIRSGRGVTR